MASEAFQGLIPGHVSPKVLAHLLACVHTPAVQSVNVLLAAVHKAADEPVVAEDDGSHLRDVLVALVFSDVGTVIYQA